MTAAGAWEEAGVVAAAAVEASGADGWGGSVVMGSEVVVVGSEEDMIEQEQYDTKVLGARVLPGLGQRL
jgi:hypothetical protein